MKLIIVLLLTIISMNMNMEVAKANEDIPLDHNQDWVVGDFELLSFIDYWAAGCYHRDSLSNQYEAGCDTGTNISGNWLLYFSIASEGNERGPFNVTFSQLDYNIDGSWFCENSQDFKGTIDNSMLELTVQISNEEYILYGEVNGNTIEGTTILGTWRAEKTGVLQCNDAKNIIGTWVGSSCNTTTLVNNENGSWTIFDGEGGVANGIYIYNGGSKMQYYTLETNGKGCTPAFTGVGTSILSLSGNKLRALNGPSQLLTRQ